MSLIKYQIVNYSHFFFKLDVDAIEDQIKAKKEQKQKEETRERAIGMGYAKFTASKLHSRKLFS